ncbi:MAG TPA: chloride channel protein [Cyanobacteria bacterium UBA11159]|nr:chloride channel protein [Cyanobacteria bacterium UBA11367]HBE56969.1 chloride channel protein [Cyanobacteria bacterium UBA11366]HBK65079.1 chloride channel protein [Cyanobacteria bacterium UBA11166]HBR72219.1 chloride channel protein [Cyanobacteria bacterium UBA11159]HBS72462.1 chloride channel protein [Cyanobacteria bacterium UBA11153]HCA95642.1 chloride channel protein [Cyanobacteria bacterium UBA9226]
MHFRQWLLPRRRLAIAEACLIGLVSGLSAVFLKYSIGWFGSWRIQASEVLPVAFVLPVFGFSLGWLSGFLVERLAPEASGSGIPQIKAALAKFPISLDLRVAFVKLISTVLALAAGLTMGRQGPTVHIGAALAAQFSRWFPTSPNHRRQMIAAGAGAGLAAGFNAPIAGILFIVEELLQDFSGLTLGTAILASFIGAVISRILGGNNLDLNLELTNISSSFSAPEIPFYLILGVCAGFLGALFNRGILVSLTLFGKLNLTLPIRVGLAGFICGAFVALLPPDFRNNSGLQELLISSEPGWKFTSIAFVVYFLLTLVSYGCGASGGLFHPSLVLGSALGYLVGVCEQNILGFGNPTNYALAGMGSFFSAVSKVPLTAIVIVFEITTDFNLVLPLMIGSVVSYLISDQFAKGSLYQRLLEWNGYTQPENTSTNESLDGLRAADLMQRHVETLPSHISLDEAMKVISRSSHRGFPVVENSLLVGIISQSDLKNATQGKGDPPSCPLPGATKLKDIMTRDPVTIIPQASLADVLYLLNRYQLSRLPVTEGRKLVGIITRSDIIRGEIDRLDSNQTGFHPEPSYIVYQTRSPATGKGRILVPIANPQTTPFLLKLAAAIAREQDYELECLQIILVSRTHPPAETPVRTTQSRRLLHQAEKIGRDLQVPVHTQIRTSHDIAQAILETIKERHINLIIMGWRGNTSNPGMIFGNVVDRIIQQAFCDVMLVKMGEKLQPPYPLPFFNRWLIPIAGGRNSQRAIALLPPLLSLSSTPPHLNLCQVLPPGEDTPSTKILDSAIASLTNQIDGNITKIPIRAHNVAEAVINLTETEDCDVVVLGASREGLLKQAIQGNIPEAIARSVRSTVILIRAALD